MSGFASRYGLLKISVSITVLASFFPFSKLCAQTFSVVYTFTGGSDGGWPEARLTKDKSGNLYGTATLGGTACDGRSFGCGTIFKVSPDGSETVLHSFEGSDGFVVADEVILDKAGNIFGTAQEGGGGGPCDNGTGCGTVYELMPDDSFSWLYAFVGEPDGAYPSSGLLKGPQGAYYGTTEGGGSGNCGNINPSGCGTLYKVARGGTETVLYSFAGGSDGMFPQGTPLSDTAGNLYGVAYQGGGGSCDVGGFSGCGTIYEFTAGGAETVLHDFSGGSDGALPFGSLIMDSSGNIYGTTSEGGNSGCTEYGCGTVFKLGSDGAFSVLHSFSGGTDGGQPMGRLFLGRDGDLYGTTVSGGNACSGEGGCGTIFKLAPDGTMTILHAFNGASDGSFPYGGLIKGPGGYLYGTASEGAGTGCFGFGCGTVFKIKK